MHGALCLNSKHQLGIAPTTVLMIAHTGKPRDPEGPVWRWSSCTSRLMSSYDTHDTVTLRRTVAPFASTEFSKWMGPVAVTACCTGFSGHSAGRLDSWCCTCDWQLSVAC
jgi:hypothetical protein